MYKSRKIKRNFHFLEKGKPFSEIVIVEHTDADEALKLAMKGKGRKITLKELEEKGYDPNEKC